MADHKHYSGTLVGDLSSGSSPDDITIKFPRRNEPPRQGHNILHNDNLDEQILKYDSSTITDNQATVSVSDIILHNFYDGDSVELDPTRINISGGVITLSVEDAVSGIVLSKTASIIDAEAGQALIDLTPTDTDLPAQEYKYDVQQDSGGVVKTLDTGIFEVLDDITP